jgi:tetratricopeptide (TPR) repeat protein
MIPTGMILGTVQHDTPNCRSQSHWSLGQSVFLGFAAIAAFSLPLHADDIYLKNGRKITGAVIQEDAQQVEYEQAGGVYSIPRSLVDRIDRAPTTVSDLPRGETLHSRPRDTPPLPSLNALDTSTDPTVMVIRNNSVDEAQLQKLDGEVLRDPTDENRYRLALGYRQACAFLSQSGKPDKAAELYRHALNFAPDDLNLTLGLGYLLVTQKQFSKAVDLLLAADAQHPDSPDVPLLLGSAYYYTENLSRAVEEWKRSVALRDDPRVREALAKAEQEKSIVGGYQEMRSLHFLLRYQGSSARQLADDVLRALEEDFRDLQLDLDVYPQESIVVLLYPDQAFNDITKLPSWAGAVNDGKIRIPVSGLTSMTPDLSRVLKHELTHSFVHQATQGRCPVWFNEGLAQLEEGATTVTSGVRLARALVANQTFPYTDLETSFFELPQDKVGMAYAKSLAALEFIREKYGMLEVRRLLKLMATNPDFSSLLQNELRLTYPAFEQDVATYIENRYGS